MLAVGDLKARRLTNSTQEHKALDMMTDRRATMYVGEGQWGQRDRTAAHILAAYQEIGEAMGLEGKVSVVITDSAANMPADTPRGGCQRTAGTHRRWPSKSTDRRNATEEDSARSESCSTPIRKR